MVSSWSPITSSWGRRWSCCRRRRGRRTGRAASQTRRRWRAEQDLRHTSTSPGGNRSRGGRRRRNRNSYNPCWRECHTNVTVSFLQCNHSNQSQWDLSETICKTEHENLTEMFVTNPTTKLCTVQFNFINHNLNAMSSVSYHSSQLTNAM